MAPVAVFAGAGVVGSAVGGGSGWGAAAAVLGCHVPVVWGSWCLAGRWCGRRRDARWDARELVLCGLIYFSSLIAIGLVLGLTGQLTPVMAQGSSALVGLGMAWHGRRYGFVPGATADGRRGTRLLRGVVMVVCVVVGWQALAAPDYAYDVLTYHLFFPARWVQDGVISIVPTWFGDPAPAYAPSGTEVFYAWLILPVGGDALARAGQFPFWLLLLCAAGGLGRELRVPVAGRAVACLALALIPAIAYQARTAMVDVALAAHATCLALFALRAARTRAASDVGGAMLAAGLMLSTKFIAVVYVAAMTPLLVWSVVRIGGAKAQGRPALGFGWRARRALAVNRRLAVLAAAIVAAWTGLFWYARNTVVTGNPVFPLEVRIGSAVLFGGAYGREHMENSVFNVRRGGGTGACDDAIREILHAPGGPAGDGGDAASVSAHRGAMRNAPFILTAVLFAASMMRHGRDRRLRRLLYLDLSIAAMFAAFWWVLPFQQGRFAWAPLALGVVVAAGAVRRNSAAALVIIVLAAGVWTAAFASEWRDQLPAPALVWIAAVFAAGIVTTSALHRARWIMPVAATVVLFAAIQWSVAGVGTARSDAMRSWPYLGGVWAWADRAPSGVTIAYAGNNVPYFLLGPRLNHRVQYVPARAESDGRYHDFLDADAKRLHPRLSTAGPPLDRYVMDPSQWLANVRRSRVDYVVVNALFTGLLVTHRHDADGYPIEREWLDVLCDPAHAGGSASAELVLANRGARVYRMRYGEAGAPSPPLRGIRQTEADAIDQVFTDGTPPISPIRHYPHAGPVIFTHRLAHLPVRTVPGDDAP